MPMKDYCGFVVDENEGYRSLYELTVVFNLFLACFIAIYSNVFQKAELLHFSLAVLMLVFFFRVDTEQKRKTICIVGSMVLGTNFLYHLILAS